MAPSWLAALDVIECISSHLNPAGVAALRCTCRCARVSSDAVCRSLAPSALAVCTPRTFVALKSLDLSRLTCAISGKDLCLALPQLTRLTSLAISGQGCAGLGSDALVPVGALTRLRSLTVQGCRKVRWQVMGTWHALRLTSLTVVGVTAGPHEAAAGPLGAVPPGARSGGHHPLAAFLEAGCASTLERLVLGDARTLSFTPSTALAAALAACSPAALRHLDLSGCLEAADEGLAPVTRLTALSALVLHNCMKIGDRAVKAVACLPQLRVLSLRGCSQLGDHHLAELMRGQGALEELTLQACNGLTGACLAALPSGAPRLVALNLSHCMRLEERHLNHLAHLPALRRLDLAGCMAPSAQGLACLAALSALTSLGAQGWTERAVPARLRQPAQARAGEPAHQQLETDAQAGAALPAAAPMVPLSGVGSNAPAVVAAASAPDGWQLPRQVQRLEMRGASLTVAALRRLLRSLPEGLTHLDMSQCQLVPDGNGWGLGSGSGSSGGSSGGSRTGGLNRNGSRVTGVTVHYRRARHLDQEQASSQGGSHAQQPLLCAPDLQALSALTALTALQISGVGMRKRDASSLGCPDDGAEDSLDGCADQEAGSSSDAGIATSWPGALDGLAGLRTPWAVHGVGSGGGARSAAARASSKGRSNVRRVLDLEAWADHEQYGGLFGGAGSGGCAASMGSCGTDAFDGLSSWQGLLPGGVGSGGSNATCTCSGLSRSLAAGGVVVQFEGSLPASPFRGTLGAVASGGACSRCSRTSSPMARAWAPGPAPTSHAATPQPRVTWLTPLAQLQRLSLTHSPWLGDTELASLAQLHALRCLDVTGCRNLSGSGFLALSGVSHLAELVLAGCSGLTDAGATAAAAALGRSLRHLDLSGCSALGESGIAALLAAAEGLRSLLLAGNGGVGDRTLVAASRLRHLRRLDASLCGSVDDGALVHLTACPSLAEVNVRSCWQLSEQGVHALLSQSTSILSLNVEGCYRLFGCQSIPNGFASTQQDPSRPGVLTRQPPRAAEEGDP